MRGDADVNVRTPGETDEPISPCRPFFAALHAVRWGQNGKNHLHLKTPHSVIPHSPRVHFYFSMKAGMEGCSHLFFLFVFFMPPFNGLNPNPTVRSFTTIQIRAITLVYIASHRDILQCYIRNVEIEVIENASVFCL